MFDLKRSSYFSSLKDMEMYRVHLAHPRYGLVESPAEFEPGDELPFFGVVFFLGLSLTLLPLLPYSLSLIFSATWLGTWANSWLPFSFSNMAKGYLASIVILLVLGVLWLIQGGFQKAFGTKATEPRARMSRDQALFFLSARIIESLTSYQVNRAKPQKQQAEEDARRLLMILVRMDPRPKGDPSPFVHIPEDVVKDLLVLMKGASKVLAAIGRGKPDLVKIRDVLEPMSIIFYSYLPELDGILDEGQLADLELERKNAWVKLQVAIQRLHVPTGSKDTAESKLDSKPARAWAKTAWTLFVSILVGFLASLFIVGVIWYFAAGRVSATGRDNFTIASLSAIVACTVGFATLTFNAFSKFAPQPEGSDPTGVTTKGKNAN